MLKRNITRVIIALAYGQRMPRTISRAWTHFQERAASGVDRLQQTCICNTDSIRTETNHVTVLLVQLFLRLDVRLSIMVVEAPDIRELRQKWTGNLFQRRMQVGNNILNCQCNGTKCEESECQREQCHTCACNVRTRKFECSSRGGFDLYNPQPIAWDSAAVGPLCIDLKERYE